ncbi:MAG: leucine-rich repeat protein [Bacteroidales bacterium]|nr:leucine-rich repeat protein [Bacteroidales bacterium]
MFHGCFKLTTSPVLPATTLVDNCYKQMFAQCSKLNKVTCLATNISATDCTTDWLSDVAATGVLFKAPLMNDWTPNSTSGIPTGWTVVSQGELPGQFTVNAAGGKVRFSQGNLQYQASTNTWRFAEHQEDYVGDADNGNVYVGEVKSNNAFISSSYDGWIDLFGWGTSGYDHGANCYQPYSTSISYLCYKAYGSDANNLNSNTGQADWGYNAISNGGNVENLWRTMTTDEWKYLVNTRSTTTNLATANARFAIASVGATHGLILFPDNYTHPNGVTAPTSVNNGDAGTSLWDENQYNAEDWAKMEAAGCVFLPAAGYREGLSVGYINNNGEYWSATRYSDIDAYLMSFYSGAYETMVKAQHHYNRYYGYPVRLVQNKEGSGSISYTTTAVEKMSTESAFTNELTLVGDGTVTYALSAGDAICTVDESTGEVTLNGNTGTCTITATVANSTFFNYATTTASYTLTVKTPQQTPLTFEAKEAGATVTFTSELSKTVEYSTDGTTWTTYTEPITLTNVGDKASFRGANGVYSSNDKYSTFSCTECYIYGNIMSLITKDNFATKTDLQYNNYAFKRLFRQSDNGIYNHPSKELLLPATTLSQSCYSAMFEYCTHLTSAPALPATTLQDYCYEYMFNGCTQLTSAPALPATTLKKYSYQNMFAGCTQLTSAPALPATMLNIGCYGFMFFGCTSLTTAPDILPATELKSSCYSHMFDGCTSLTTAPVLPATTTVDNCYYNMFNGCTKLNSVTCFAKFSQYQNPCTNWLLNVAATGTFHKAVSMNDWPIGASGIPQGWTVVPPSGAIDGKFTVNANGGQVYFSKGNLQATGTTSSSSNGGWTWSFAEHQWDYVGNTAANTTINGNGTISADGTVDLFYWSSSKSYFGIHNSQVSEFYGSFVDWDNITISNGGTGWHTLTNDQWAYLFNSRATGKTINGTDNARYTMATINTDGTAVNGIILFPDDYAAGTPAGVDWGTINAACNWTAECTKCTAAGWASLEAAGAVFLPGAGRRDGIWVYGAGERCWYWSSTPTYNVRFENGLFSQQNDNLTCRGSSVRLAKGVNITEGSIGYSTTEVNKTTADAAFTNPLTKEGEGTVTYAKSGDDICTVNANTGLVTLNGNPGTCTITATVANSMFYTYATNSVSYTLMVTEATPEQTPLTFEAKIAGAKVTFTSTMGTPPTLEYSKNGGVWTSYTSSIILTNIGDKVSFRGNNTSYGTNSTNSSFSCSEDCYIYGNVMSLVNSTGYPTATGLSETYTFYKLFNGNTHIVNHATKTLVLPATTLTEGCYDFMFAGCTGLTSSPIETLPATTLAQSCYLRMFDGCTNMTTAPTLSATTVGVMSCYMMFQDCSALESAPALSAETIGNSCYAYMFKGCSSIESAPALPATTLANGCYRSMFEGCTSLTVAPALPATTLTESCYNTMFDGCTSLTTAPALPAKTTAQYCYSYMFRNCLNLNSVTCYATPNSANTNYWLYNVASTGTFYKASTASWSSGESGIPTGWTVIPVLDLSTVSANTTVTNNCVITGTLSSNKKISIADGAMVTLSGATINGVNNGSYQWAGLNCLGDATIILAEGTTNTVKGFYEEYPGIHIPSGYTLTIQGTGRLNASSNGYATGIGGGWKVSCGNITIGGGTVTVTGGTHAAGIGSGSLSSCGVITISGGTVTANGGKFSSGIGSGYKSSCGNINISGGTVEATSGETAAGIGSGYDQSSCGAITISGGMVTATGGQYSAGIGSSHDNSSCGTITISGGTVEAWGGEDGAGIGSGYYNSSCGIITISGGTVTATGGQYSAGIGTGYYGTCEAGITIENTVTRVTATKGSGATNSIGKGNNGTCGTVTIGGNTGAVSTSPYTYQP